MKTHSLTPYLDRYNELSDDFFYLGWKIEHSIVESASYSNQDWYILLITVTGIGYV